MNLDLLKMSYFFVQKALSFAVLCSRICFCPISFDYSLFLFLFRYSLIFSTFNF